MPTVGAMIQLKAGLYENYVAITTKDLNTIYFCTDTQQMFIGETEYTRPVMTGTSLPTIDSPVNTIFYHTTEKALYSNINGTWTKVSNLYTHPTSGVTAGAYGDTTAQTPAHGGKFKVPSFTVDANGHLTVAGSHDVTLPAETQLSRANASGTPSTLTHGGKFTATTGVAVAGHEVTETKTEFTLPAETTLSKGSDEEAKVVLTNGARFEAVTGYTVSGHQITATVTEFKLPTDNNTTYTFATGSSNGTIDVTPSEGTKQSVSVKGLAGAAYKAVDTAVSSTSENLPTSKAVQTAINSAIAGVTQFDVQVVTALPTTGQKGVIYLVSHSHGTKDIYDEYIWNTAATTPAFEKIGSTDIDLSAYLTSETAADTYIPKVTGASGKVAQFDASGNVVSSGYTIAANVPSGAKFTDTVYTHPAGSGASKTSGLYKFSTDGTSHISGVTAVSKADIIALGIPAQDTNTTYTLSGAANTSGGWVTTLTPSSGSATTSTVPKMSGASASAAGAAGLVPAPSAGDQAKFLRADGTWVVPTDTVYTLPAATDSVLGGVKLGYTTSGKNYAVVKDASNNLYVNVPWTDNNTDTKVTNTLATTTKAYITGTTSAATSTGTQVFDTGVYLDTTAGMLTATTFKGALQGNADTATKATQDASGNVITSTYATKTELNNAKLVWGTF